MKMLGDDDFIIFTPFWIVLRILVVFVMEKCSNSKTRVSELKESVFLRYSKFSTEKKSMPGMRRSI